MKSIVNIQKSGQFAGMPTLTEIRKWARLALQHQPQPVEITVKLVDLEEMSALNQQYRHKKGPTNVLSFSYQGDWPENDAEYLDNLPYLGDLVIAPQLLEAEATAQHKSLTAHWAHIVIHGTLHLQGFDHETPEEAEVMEQQEIQLLASLKIADPYGDIKSHD